MAQQIIRQPNGKFAIFSSISDTLVAIDLTVEELKELWISEAKREAVRHVDHITEALAKGETPYMGWSITYAEAVETHMRFADNSTPEFTKLVQESMKGQ